MDFLAREAGIRQFVQVGTGLPLAGSTHEVAQAVAPQLRVVYVDSEPMALTHARALFTSTPDGATAYVDAEVREPGTILAEAARILDFSRPAALIMFAALGQVPDSADPPALLRRLMNALLTRPMLEAIRSPQPTVLRVDEVDRVDAETEALFLEVLGEHQVSVPEVGRLTARHLPWVFLTSNATRDLSEALKRRCLFLYSPHGRGTPVPDPFKGNSIHDFPGLTGPGQLSYDSSCEQASRRRIRRTEAF